MRRFFERFKPAAERKTHALAGAVMWSLVGLGLLTAGVRWCHGAGLPDGLFLFVAGALTGVAKGHFVLARTARRAADRIEERPDGSCIGGFISWRSWGLVLVMMSAGMLLRHSPIPRPWLGLIYTAIGTAMLVGSRIFWALYRRLRLSGA